jgi:hypothetical protein
MLAWDQVRQLSFQEFISNGWHYVVTLCLLFPFSPHHPLMTASDTLLAGNIPSTLPRNKQVLGLITPAPTPDSPLRPNSSGFHFNSPPHTPTRHPDIPKDKTSLTVSGNPSECYSDQSTFLLQAGLLTPVKIVLSGYWIRRALASARMLCPFPEYCPVFQGYRDNVSGGLDI